MSLNFAYLFIIGKYVKIRFRNIESPYYFFISRVQKIKNVTTIRHKRLFLLTFLVSYFMWFLTLKLVMLYDLPLCLAH